MAERVRMRRPARRLDRVRRDGRDAAEPRTPRRAARPPLLRRVLHGIGEFVAGLMTDWR